MREETAKDKIKNYLSIYWTMFKIGITTFGGGYAMVAIIDRELCDRKNWIDKEELLNYIAVAQITPGVIAVNVSTFVGRKRGGILGAVFATAGVITPSILIILTIAILLTRFAEYEVVRHALAGIRVCVCVLVINATIGFIKKTVVDLLSFVIFLCVFIVAAFTRVETVWIVLSVLFASVIGTVIMSGKAERAEGSVERKADAGETQKSAGSEGAKPEEAGGTERGQEGKEDEQ